MAAAVADVTSMHQTLSFSGNFYEEPDAPAGHIELYATADAVLACAVVDLNLRCSQTTPEQFSAEETLLLEYGAHGTVDLGEKAAEYADAALTFVDVTDQIGEPQDGDTAYYMLIDPSQVDATVVGLDPKLLVQVEQMSALVVLDADGVPYSWNVTMSAGNTVATVTTVVDEVNAPVDVLDRLGAALAASDGANLP